MITPLRDRIVVKRCDPETKTAGGLIISAPDKKDEGIVVAVGPGKKSTSGELIPLTVKVGDRVLFAPNVGQTIKTEEGPCLAMREDDLIGIFQ